MARAKLIEQGSLLAMEAVTISRVLGDNDSAAEFASNALEELIEDVDESEAAAAAAQRLRDAFLEATGEEWESSSCDTAEE